MPSLFNVTDKLLCLFRVTKRRERIVTAKPNHVHFVYGLLTAGTITCSPLTVNGNRSVVDISGSVNLESETLTGSLASCLLLPLQSTTLQASSLSVMNNLSVNGSIQANTLSSAVGAFSSVSSNTIIGTNTSVTGLLSTGTTCSSLCTSANIVATNHRVQHKASVTQVLAAGTISGSAGSLTSIFATSGTFSQVPMHTISASSAGIPTLFCNSIQGSARRKCVLGNVSVRGMLNMGSISGGPAKFSSISASASSISSVMSAGSGRAVLGNFSSLIGSNIVLSGNATVTGSIS